ncbi:Peptide ABC transporter periplasmic peptide-binding protein, partial [Pseudomonas coronafaciens pv. garcae]
MYAVELHRGSCVAFSAMKGSKYCACGIDTLCLESCRGATQSKECNQKNTAASLSSSSRICDPLPFDTSTLPFGDDGMGIKGFARSIALLSLFSSFSALAGKADDTLVYASDSEPENISPYHNDLREGVILGRLIWDNLVYRNPDNGQYEPMLATRWKQVDDTTIDFQLREGVKFHNGDPFTADDVVFTLNYVVSPESKVVTVQNVDWIKSAEKLGEYSVRLHLKKPFPPALEYLSNAVPMFPQKYFEQVGMAGFSRKPIGTGPYKVTAIAAGEGVKMDKNPDYFKDSPQGQPKI